MASNDPKAGFTSSAPTDSPANETKPPGDRSSPEIIKSFEGFLSFILTLSIFGASTFSIIVSEIANPNAISPDPRFTRETVRTLLGIAWLLFVLALGIVAVSMSLLAFQREHPTTGVESPWRQTWERLGLVASALIQVSVIAAFLLLSLVLVAYTEAVGWVAVALTSTVAFLVLISLAFQWV
jgi:Na+/proline symporter